MSNFFEYSPENLYLLNNDFLIHLNDLSYACKDINIESSLKKKYIIRLTFKNNPCEKVLYFSSKKKRDEIFNNIVNGIKINIKDTYVL